jgi:cytochrome c peroxidase
MRPVVVFALLGSVVGCLNAPEPIAISDAGRGSDPLDPEPTFTQDERAILSTLTAAALPAPPVDVSNRFADDPKAARLGQRLFFDPSFSGALLDGDNDGSAEALGTKGQVGKVACAGCHVAEGGFLDNRSLQKQISLASGWGRRRAPSLLDVGQAKLVMWDGRHDALYNQPFGAIENPLEMNSSRLFVAQRLFFSYREEYEAVFGPLPQLDHPRFGAISAAQTGCQPSSIDPQASCNGTRRGMPGDGAEFDALAPVDRDAVTRVVVNLGKAIAAYERQLSCGPGRFDRWMGGDPNALTRAEQRGAALFAGKGQCAGCHSGPYFSDQKFHNVGLMPELVATVFIDLDDRGAAVGLLEASQSPLNVRGAFSDGDDGRLLAVPQAPSLEGAFKTPMLRCSDLRPSFMHTGQLRTLESVAAFFSRGGDRFGFPGTNELAVLDLTPREQADLVAFIKALRGPGPPVALRGPP